MQVEHILKLAKDTDASRYIFLIKIRRMLSKIRIIGLPL